MSGFAIVTGGSTGIGRHLVSAFAEAGYAVAFSFRGDDEAANTLMEEVEAGAGRRWGSNAMSALELRSKSSSTKSAAGMAMPRTYSSTMPVFRLGRLYWSFPRKAGTM